MTFLSFEEKNFLLKNIDSSNTLALMSIGDISDLLHRAFKKDSWDGQENLRMAQKALYYCQSLKIKILLNSDNDYPELLRQINDPPFLLFCRGNEKALTENKNISIVGTRRITPSGKEAAQKLAYDAAMAGYNVVSGLANGADGFAHKGALNAYFDSMDKGETEQVGKTIAVLPSAIDEVVPTGHKRLAEQILQTGGCLISEYEPKTPIVNWHFVGRNRIIAGLSSGVVVVEAPAGSGALITADFAIEYNRDLMVHEVSLGEMAQSVSANVKDQLKNDYAAGKVSKYKYENTLEKYLEQGAPVIKNFADFCKCQMEEPGKRFYKNQQGLLFEDE
ncbi:MAG: DNA-processing protein DprA [Treponema sp.]|nr:DNA-processing protein DprA [Treponema sp.]